ARRWQRVGAAGDARGLQQLPRPTQCPRDGNHAGAGNDGGAREEAEPGHHAGERVRERAE
ncbi:unnamed protein product, partial [Durusdinium trenchii]